MYVFLSHLTNVSPLLCFSLCACLLYHPFCINPSVTARVKISKNVDILAKVYLVHLTVTARVKISQNVDILAKVYLVHLTLL